ncbi:hypothetical protein HY493_02550 [Candidatus Woesearchaeota archaeon]|nr:hypothetical protein [Candidatus Woesearchaeota archaeon]
MKPIGKALLELRTTLFSIGLFNSLLDSFLVLLFTLLGLILLKLPWELAFIPFAVYFVWHTRTILRALGYNDVEARVPQLREALRTAADSLETENEVVRGLHQEVLDKMRLIQTSVFVGFSKVTRQLLVLALLSFIIISVSALNISFLDAQTLLQKTGVIGIGGVFGDDDTPFFARLSKRDDGNKLFGKEVTLLDETSLYGNATVIELGTEELNLELNPEGSGIKMGEVKDPESKKFTDQPSPSDIQATADSAYAEDIPKEYQSIVRNYFKGIPK